MTTLRLCKTLLASTALGSLLVFPATVFGQGELKRLVAEFDYFGFEASTANEPPGIAIYRKTINVPSSTNTLYLTMSTTGDTHDGAASCFTALLDGNFFNPGGQGAARCADNGETPVDGWITLLKVPANSGENNCNDGGGGPGDCHDNNIHYEWCSPVEPGRHEVEIRMATDSEGKDVFIEQAHFYVDASRLVGFRIDENCVQAKTPQEMEDAAAAAARSGARQ